MQKNSSEFSENDRVLINNSIKDKKIRFDLVTDNYESENSYNYILKIFSPNGKMILSDILPVIENLGFKALEEYNIIYLQDPGKEDFYIHNFVLDSAGKILQDDYKQKVESVLDAVINSSFINDRINTLASIAEFDCKQITIVRALIRYMLQTTIPYSEALMQKTLIQHHKYTKGLIHLFQFLFHPNFINSDSVDSQLKFLSLYLKDVKNSTEDTILRIMMGLVQSITRTNAYMDSCKHNIFEYIAFKFDSIKVPYLPKPLPFAEIFVYSKNFEGVHLRGGKVSRGGIRWSDRVEDYRTEVLGLMKAQMTKNTVIIPVGSKGGFILKFNSDGLGADEYKSLVVKCYQNFLRGILDITDNIVEKEIVHPKGVVVRDSKDPYLVVAADKGTATFSDFANQISAEYKFWLGDAFASGGSVGYDHKKMGITAKGAWISVKRHFHNMNMNPEKDNIAVVGIGDMAGDVFGNGMLRSKTIKLVAAFNHMHIFIDPNPEPAKSYEERVRIFNMPISTWKDYNQDIISEGGGVFDRNAKEIHLSKEIQKLLDISVSVLKPYELIKAILCAKVDLIWNGGIGTYIKASTESNSDVGDKHNDLVRCDAIDIRAKVIGEGGNLGLTQCGRIEYSRYGGKINTDSVDNSAGVNCSDHEVNIKIALQEAFASQKITIAQRNKLLEEMESEVGELVLQDNWKQTQAITFSERIPTLTIEMFSNLLDEIENAGLLDRRTEYLPTPVELTKRASNRESMTRPELSVILAYSKIYYYNNIVENKILQEEYFTPYLINYFPEKMRKEFAKEILNHPLKKEIIATVITNRIINQLGGATLNNIAYNTDASVISIVLAYITVMDIFQLDKLWNDLEKLRNHLKIEVYLELFFELVKVLRRGITWLLKHQRNLENISSNISFYKESATRLITDLPSIFTEKWKHRYDKKTQHYAKNIDINLAKSIANLEVFISLFDIIYISKKTDWKDSSVASLYFNVGEAFYLDWLRKTCDRQNTGLYWHSLALQGIKDDIYAKQRKLSYYLCHNIKEPQTAISSWDFLTTYSSLMLNIVKELQKFDNININMIVVANKKLDRVIQKLEHEIHA